MQTKEQIFCWFKRSWFPRFAEIQKGIGTPDRKHAPTVRHGSILNNSPATSRMQMKDSWHLLQAAETQRLQQQPRMQLIPTSPPRIRENSAPLQQFSKLARETTGGSDPRGMPNLQKYATNDMPGQILADKSGGISGQLHHGIGAIGKNDPALGPLRELAEANAQFELVAALRSGDTGRVQKINKCDQ